MSFFLRCFLLISSLLFSISSFGSVSMIDAAESNLGAKYGKFINSGKTCALEVTSEHLGDDNNTTHYHFKFIRPSGLSENLMSSSLSSPINQFWSISDNSLEFIIKPDDLYPEGVHEVFKFSENSLAFVMIEFVSEGDTCLLN